VLSRSAPRPKGACGALVQLLLAGSLTFIGKTLLEGTGFCRKSHPLAGSVFREDVTAIY
jgi:hypothetical protein